jgi:hypothetical protein
MQKFFQIQFLEHSIFTEAGMARTIVQKLHGNSDEQTSTVELRVLWLLLVCVVSAIGIGCPSTVSHQPNEGIVDTLGVPQAQQLLKDTLLRSVNPRVDDVEVTDDFMRYHLAGTAYDVRIFFKDVQRAEVYNNNVVLIWGGDQRMLARPLLANTQEATTFADLVLSFARRAGGSTR